jgi:4-amino-4-deoxy-L-arabinose transferase-like glycosyltransferase
MAKIKICNECGQKTTGKDIHYCQSCASVNLREANYSRNFANKRNIAFYSLILIFIIVCLGIILLLHPAKIKINGSSIIISEFSKLAITNHPAIMVFLIILLFVTIIAIVVSFYFMPRIIEEVKR